MTLTLPPGLAPLGALPNWVNWNLEPRPGDPKPTKVPYTPSTTGPQVKAKAGEPATWGDAATAFAAANAGRFTGVGFEFHAGEGLLLFDMDSVIDAAGKIASLARATMALLGSYAEPSPSNTGIRIIAAGELPRPLIAADRQGKKKDGLELYGGAHFGTITCRPFKGYDQVRHVDTATMVRLFALWWPDEMAAKVAPSVPLPPLMPTLPDDRELLEKAFAAKNGADLHARHTGTIIHSDPSGDDFAYLTSLAFWTQRDAGRMRRIAAASGRAQVRTKWQSRRGAGDLLDYNIAKACAEQHTVYDPGQVHGARFIVPETGEVVTDFDQVAAQFTRDLAEAERRLAVCRSEHARKDALIAGLESEVAALTAAIQHPDQTIGGVIGDLADAMMAGYERGDTQVLDGRESVCVVQTQVPTKRSASTVNRALTRILAAGHVPFFDRPIRIENERFDKEVPIKHIYIPEEIRHDRGKVMLYLLPPAEEKKHGGARKKRDDVPVSEKHPDAPVKVVTERRDVWRSLVDDKVLRVDQRPSSVAYYAADGEELTAEEGLAYQEALGVIAPKRVPTYRPPVQRALSETDRDLVRPVPFDLDAPLPISLHGPRCRMNGCGLRPDVSGYCKRHIDTRSMVAGAD